jgi:hypothetical protein
MKIPAGSLIPNVMTVRAALIVSARRIEEIKDQAAEGDEGHRTEGEWVGRRWHSLKREEMSSVPPMVVKGERWEIRAVRLEEGRGRKMRKKVVSTV